MLCGCWRIRAGSDYGSIHVVAAVRDIGTGAMALAPPVPRDVSPPGGASQSGALGAVSLAWASAGVAGTPVQAPHQQKISQQLVLLHQGAVQLQKRKRVDDSVAVAADSLAVIWSMY